MAIEQKTLHWTQEDLLKSLLYFVGHFLLLLFIVAALLLGDKLSELKMIMSKNAASYSYVLLCIILLVCILYFYFYYEGKHILASGKHITLIFCILDIYVIIAYLLGNYFGIYTRPVAFIGLMTFMLVGRKEAIFLNVIGSLVMFIIDTFGVEATTAMESCSSLIISFSAGMIAIFFCEKAKTRFRIIGIGLLIVIPIDFVIFLLGLSSLIGPEADAIVGLSPWQVIFTNMGKGLFGGIMSTVFFLTLLPVFEGLFNCLTVFRIRELTSSDAKILKRLKVEASGTYTHVTVVSQLAEACAAAIGENMDYARAAALYHDVGKLHHPEYFTENQHGYNVHDELLPELSADLIRSHASEGYALIRKSHLPEFLADVALQHHGTLPIRYFYAKALKLSDGELNMEDFSYRGPKPQSKIAAIIMIADAAEAAVRASGNRSPENVEKCVRKIIDERMELEQFAECDITMVDLTRIRWALVNELSGVYHHRIKYPSIKYKKTAEGKMKGENSK